MQHVDLRVTQQGSVCGLDIFLDNCNTNCATSISELWASMHLQGHLSQPLHGWGQNGLWLQDLVLFTGLLQAVRNRRVLPAQAERVGEIWDWDFHPSTSLTTNCGIKCCNFHPFQKKVLWSSLPGGSAGTRCAMQCWLSIMRSRWFWRIPALPSKKIIPDLPPEPASKMDFAPTAR